MIPILLVRKAQPFPRPAAQQGSEPRSALRA